MHSNGANEWNAIVFRARKKMGALFTNASLFAAWWVEQTVFRFVGLKNIFGYQ
jgi:hypothetical protein